MVLHKKFRCSENASQEYNLRYFVRREYSIDLQLSLLAKEVRGVKSIKN